MDCEFLRSHRRKWQVAVDNLQAIFSAIRVLKMQVMEPGAQLPPLQVPCAEIVGLQFGLATSKEFVRVLKALNLPTHFCLQFHLVCVVKDLLQTVSVG